MFTKEPANTNLDIDNITTADLNGLLPRYSDEEFAYAGIFEKTLYDRVMSFCTTHAHKVAKKRLIPIELIFAVVAIVAINVAITFVLGLHKRNPVAAESVRRHLKEVMHKF